MRGAVIVGLAFLAVLSGSYFFSKCRQSSAVLIPAEVVSLYSQWKRSFGKLYATPAEQDYRLRVFYEQKQFVDAKNREYNLHAETTGQKLSGPMFSLNGFADLSTEEFVSQYQGLKETDEDAYVDTHDVDVPTLVSDNKKKMLAQTSYEVRVRNQGACGSCWAFAAVANFEKYFWDWRKQRMDFSQQQLIDCQTGSDGCHGGTIAKGLDYFLQYGAALESAYPYKAVEGSCNRKVDTYKIRLTVGRRELTTSRLASYIKDGMHVAISVTGSDTFRYLSETDDVYDAYKDPDCSNRRSHAVNAIETDSDGTWFRILNSWSPRWGFKGTKRIKPCSDINIYGDGSYMTYAY